MTLRVLDLYCGAGGAAMGYYQAFGPDTEIVGVDIAHQKRYPFEFRQLDVVAEILNKASEIWVWFDLIHASPPCQKYSVANNVHQKEYPDLIAVTRDWLIASGKPYVIENVVGAPLHDPIMLCGKPFGLKVYRHRLFETNFPLPQPEHEPHNDSSKWRTTHGPTDNGFVSVFGHGGGRGWQEFGIGYADYARQAMGIPWMTKLELAEAIPPAYTKWIGEQWLAQQV